MPRASRSIVLAVRLAVAGALAAVGCSRIVGADFDDRHLRDASSPGVDADVLVDADPVNATKSGDAVAPPASSTAGPAATGGAGPGIASMPPTGDAGPVVVAGKRGLDITAGGNVSRSPSFRLVGAVGESPGGNSVGKSTSFTLRGGVIPSTQ